MSGRFRGAGNLPGELTSFVGRRRELADARRLLASARLVTLCGPGGVGKTRLALRLAAEVRRAFPDGVWFVGLADLRDPALLPNTVATALGLTDEAGDPAARLATYLTDKTLLLVLDNCEHLLDATAVLVDKVLSAAAGLRVLATSRQLLRAAAERVFTVPPLGLTTGGEPDALEAVTLFAERAAAVQPGFRLDDTNRETVTRICERLDGIPLAIELAAVRLRALSTGQILRRLDDRFRLLTTGSRTAAARQRTLEATLDWSHELCTPAERAAFAALSVFPGSFDLAAAEAVCGGFEIAAGDVFDLVAGMVDKSLLVRLDGTYGRTAWYSMLETMREYGRGRLAESGREDAVRARHAGYYTRLARRFRVEGFSPGQAEWIDRLRRELPSLRCAMRYSMSYRDRGRRPAEIAAPLRTFWVASGFLVEGDHWLREALACEPPHTALRADALQAGVVLAAAIGDLDRARQLVGELRELTATFGDGLARAHYDQAAGLAAAYTGDFVGSRSALAAAAAGFRRLDDPFALSTTLSLLAVTQFYLGDPGGASVAQEALALCEAHQATWSRTFAQLAVALHAWRSGDGRRSAALVREVIAMRLPDYQLLGLALSALAWCAEALGRHERAAGLLGAANAVLRISGSRIDETGPYRPFNERCRKSAHNALGAEAFDKAFAATSRFDLEEVIAWALGDDEKDTPARPANRRHRGIPGGLTRREYEIAGLIAAGLGNKQIAAELVIAGRTAETHVQNILTKLGFTSRTQIATWMTEHQVARERDA